MDEESSVSKDKIKKQVKKSVEPVRKGSVDKKKGKATQMEVESS